MQRFTPGGTQVPMVSPPKSEGEGDVPMPPPLPPMPSGLEFYEKGGQGHVGPCLRDFERSIFPGEQASEKEKFIRHALDEWDRRHFRPDGSWRQDWSPTASDPPQPPPRPPQVVASNHGVCPDGRAFSRAVLGGPLQGYGVCHDGRASGSTVLGELCQGPGVCHDSRAVFGKVLGDHLGRSGACQDGRAIPGTVLGVHQPPSCEFPDSRAFGVSYHGDRAGCQQPHCQGLRDPTVDGVGGGERGHDNCPQEKIGQVKSPRERSPQDALRSTNPTIPMLPPTNKKHASIEAADWLEEMKPIIGDISNRASKWWEMTVARTWEVCHLWLHSNPLQRIRISPPEPVPWQDLGNEQVVKRLEQRVTTILLTALPSEMRNDLVTSRQLWPSAILYKILRCYQPGGWAERSNLLTDLTSTKAAKDASSAASALRLWHRQKQRATELGASIPDALLQVRALETVVSQVVAKHPQALFRISTFRMEAGLDEKPTDLSIAQFLELLTAEMDALALGTTSLDGTATPSAKVLQLEQDGKGNKMQDAASKPCRFWGSESGCKHGRNCKFQHGALSDQSKRCFCCSSTEHRKQDCPYKDAQPSMSSSMVGGSGSVGGGKPAGKGKNGKSGKGTRTNSAVNGNGNGKGLGESQDPKVAAVSSTTTTKEEQATAATSTTSKTEDGHREQHSDPPKAATGETELVNEVTSLLRSLRAEASVKVCGVRKIQRGDQVSVLLDGGATHCLRTCHDDKEWRQARDIEVTLAEGSKLMKQCRSTKTLLTQEVVQPIIPVSMVTSLGYQVQWQENCCKISHPSRPDIPVQLVQGCPTVDWEVGMKLFDEVEQAQKEQCWIRAVLAGEESAEEDSKLHLLRELFPGVPVRLLSRLPGKTNWNPAALPFNRRR